MQPTRPRFASLIVELTNLCNFRCPFCPSESITRPKGRMEPGVFAKIVDEARRDNLADTIQLGLMGEPFLHKGVFEMAAQAAGQGLTVRCFTNGSLLTDDVLEKIGQSRIDELYISYRGLEPESFASLSSMDYDRYIRGIRALLQRAGEFTGKTIILKCFKPSLADAVTGTGLLARKLKADQSAAYVNKLLTGIGLEGVVRKNALTFHDTIDLGRNIVVRLESLAKWNDTPDPTKAERFHHGLVGACDGMRGHIGILWNGDVTTCCKDYDGKNVLGNVGEQSIRQILDGEAARRFNALMRWCVLPTPYCRVCRGGETLRDALVNQLGSIAYFRTPFFGWKER